MEILIKIAVFQFYFQININLPRLIFFFLGQLHFNKFINTGKLVRLWRGVLMLYLNVNLTHLTMWTPVLCYPLRSSDCLYVHFEWNWFRVLFCQFNSATVHMGTAFHSFDIINFFTKKYLQIIIIDCRRGFVNSLILSSDHNFSKILGFNRIFYRCFWVQWSARNAILSL